MQIYQEVLLSRDGNDAFHYLFTLLYLSFCFLFPSGFLSFSLFSSFLSFTLLIFSFPFLLQMKVSLSPSYTRPLFNFSSSFSLSSSIFLSLSPSLYPSSSILSRFHILMQPKCITNLVPFVLILTVKHHTQTTLLY